MLQLRLLCKYPIQRLNSQSAQLKTKKNYADRPIDGELIPVPVKHRSPELPVKDTNTLKFNVRNNISYSLLYFY